MADGGVLFLGRQISATSKKHLYDWELELGCTSSLITKTPTECYGLLYSLSVT